MISVVAEFRGSSSSRVLMRANRLEIGVQLIEIIAYTLMTPWVFSRLRSRDVKWWRRYKIRYADWILTTPVMITTTVALISYYDGDTGRLPWWAYVSNVCMLLSGWMYEGQTRGTKKRNKWLKWLVFFVGSSLLITTFTPMWQLADTTASKSLVVLTGVLWLCYGGVFALFDEPPADDLEHGQDPRKTLGYNILDIISKNVNSLLIAGLILT